MRNNKAYRWGWVHVEGVYFFLEKGKPIPPLCPISILPDEECPHETKGEPTPHEAATLYFCEGKYEFPENVEVKNSKIRYTGKQCLQVVKRLQKQTNYIPILIEGVRLDEQFASFIDLLYNEVVMGGRSVVLTGDNHIPLPNYVKKMKGK